MKPRLGASVACAMLAFGLAACGSAHSGMAGDGGRPAASRGGDVGDVAELSPGSDRDNDNDHNDDDWHVLSFGHAASAAESRAVTTLLKRYYAAAAAEQGGTACALLTPFVAEAVPEEHGGNPGLRGATCAAVMTKTFATSHSEIVGENATLKIVRIGIEGDKSLVALDFASIPEVRQITLRRVGRRWTVLRLLDGIIE